MMKKVVSILLVLILFFSFVDVVNASNPPEENVSFYVSDEVYQSISEKKEENQTFAEQSIALNEYFSITQQLDDEQLGGAFFDDDNKLHVLLTEDVPIAMSLTTNICYDMVPYSYKQLQTFQNIIINRRGEIGFDSCGIDQEDNVVIIYCADTLNTELLYELIPQNSVKIILENQDLHNCATQVVYPGTKLTNMMNNSYGTVACGVVWDNSSTDKKYGFLTAGHLGLSGTPVTYGPAYMGLITRSVEAGAVDAALIQRGQLTGNEFNFSNKVSDGKVFTKNGGTYPKNTIIYGYGATTTDVINGSVIRGKIIDTSFSGSFENIYFHSLIRTDAVSQPGDSGGPILTASGNTYSIIGIIKGTANGDLVYVNMDAIKTAFDLNVMNP